MTAIFDISLYSPVTLIGWVWSALTYYLMFSERGKTFFNEWRWIPVFGTALAFSVWYVIGEVDILTAMAGGLKPLDVVYGYDASAVAPLADALGDEGRRAYAEFQLRADTLAPPAFSCFFMAVFRSTVRFSVMRHVLTAMICIYFTSVLLANTLTPMIFLNYPDRSGLELLYSIVPVCDAAKYTVHGIAWLVVFSCWLVAGGQKLTGVMSKTESRV